MVLSLTTLALFGGMVAASLLWELRVHASNRRSVQTSTSSNRQTHMEGSGHADVDSSMRDATIEPLNRPGTLPESAPLHYRRTTCRICDSAALTEFLSFGPMPLANGFLTKDELGFPEPRFDLSVARCGNCGLIQVPDVVDPLVLFGHYSYFSSYSTPTVEHFRRQAHLLHQQYITDPSQLICEIGSNDGIFLRNLVGRCRLIGIDPADNIADIAATRGVTTVQRFFNPRTAAAIRTLFGPARIIFAANCIAHIDDINGVLAGIAHLLDDDGVLIFENHRFVDMLRSLCFDQIYHEHLCYYTLQPIEHMLSQHGMRVIDARTIPTHGESFQIHAALQNSPHVVQPSVEQIRRQEAQVGLHDPKTYQAFAAQVKRLRDELRELLLSLKAQGKRIAGYGAPGKSTTLLNYCGIDHTVLDYVIDSTPIKQGRFTPGTRIPIEHPDRLRRDPPDYVLLMAWNYADTILEKEREMRERGVKFIVPVPALRVV